MRVHCDAKCDEISAGRIELLARAVVLVAGMRIPEAAREAVLARLTADRQSNGKVGKRTGNTLGSQRGSRERKRAGRRDGLG